MTNREWLNSLTDEQFREITLGGLDKDFNAFVEKWGAKKTMTNREWLNSLTDEQLADFLYGGLEVDIKIKAGEEWKIVDHTIGISSVAKAYTDSRQGIIHWLNQPQQYHLKGELQ